MNIDCIAIEAATDGACSGNPGPGGWGGLIIFADKSELEIGLSLIHISEPTRRYAISYAVFCLKKYSLT